MYETTRAKKVLAVLGAAALLIAAPLALAGDEGYLGVVLQDISPSMAKALQLDEDAGVLVNEVVEDSPAAEAGLQAGDVIVSFAGTSLADYGALTKAVRAAKPGDDVDVVVLREGQKRTITVELGEREDEAFTWTMKEGDEDFEFHGEHDFEFHGEDGNVWIQRFDGEGEDPHVIIKRMHEDGDFDKEIEVIMQGLHEDRGFLGVHLDDVEGQMAAYFEVEGGALVTEVVEDSGAAAAGLQAGDVIVKLDGTEIDSAGDLHEALAGTEAEQSVKIEVVRKGKNKSMDVTLGEMPEDAYGSGMKIIGDGGKFHMTAPKMMLRMPHMNRRMHVAPHVEVIRDIEIEKEALEEMKMELEEMREELQEMRQELDEK